MNDGVFEWETEDGDLLRLRQLDGGYMELNVAEEWHESGTWVRLSPRQVAQVARQLQIGAMRSSVTQPPSSTSHRMRS